MSRQLNEPMIFRRNGEVRFICGEYGFRDYLPGPLMMPTPQRDSAGRFTSLRPAMLERLRRFAFPEGHGG